MEFHISHYDNEGIATIELAGDVEAMRVILIELGAEYVNDYRFKLPVDKLGRFCDRRFGTNGITDAQRQARRESLARARERRWRQST